jgi:hypothetical protein
MISLLLLLIPALGHQAMVTCHTSHVTRRTSHVTRRTSHVTRHTSHITRHLLRQVSTRSVSPGYMVQDVTKMKCGKGATDMGAAKRALNFFTEDEQSLP